jgi:polyisoprenyl-teichoic acid--peptidoglycan teichoic acid transferase
MKKDLPSGTKAKGAFLGKNIILYVIIFIGVILLVSGLWLNSLWNEVYLALPGDNGESIQPVPEKDKDPALPDIMNVLILGLDSRDPASRTDTLLLLTLNRGTEEINILSVPRDMRVNIPGYGMDKINHAYAYGGITLTRQTVEDFLDIHVDHYITTDFEGFTNIVDVLGGIDLEVEKEMRYYGIDVTIDLRPGYQHLDGEKALQYVRFRSDEEGDFGRVRRQQEFLKKLLEEIITFKNILKFPRLLPEIAQNVKTDLELNQVLLLANKLKNVEIGQINTCTLPGSVRYIDEISYIIPEEEEIRELVERYVKGIRARQS